MSDQETDTCLRALEQMGWLKVDGRTMAEDGETKRVDITDLGRNILGVKR